MSELIQSKAVQAHNELVHHAAAAANSLVEMARCLKAIKDDELYVDLDYSSFKDYCDANKPQIGVGYRMAQNYISAYEALGEQSMLEHADVGIAKLAMIAQLPEYVVNEELPAGTFAGMSADEIREIVASYKKQGEQIELFEKQTAEHETASAELTAALDAQKQNADKLKKELTDAKLAKDEAEKAAAAQPKEIEKEVFIVDDSEVARLTSEVNRLTKELKLSDQTTTIFKERFDSAQKALISAREIVNTAPEDMKEKFTKAFNALLDGAKIKD